MARPVPVLPEVGSMIVPPGRRRPSRSAASTRRMATRSLIEPPGLKYSTFATSCGVTPAPMRLRRMSGVSPTVSRTESLMSAVSCAVSELVGMAGWYGPAARLPLPDERHAVGDERHGRVDAVVAGDAVVELG